MTYISTSDKLYGIKYWASWWAYPRKPKFEIFVYFGLHKDTGEHWFRNRKYPSIFIQRNEYQLRVDPHFKPFLINSAILNDPIIFNEGA